MGLIHVTYTLPMFITAPPWKVSLLKRKWSFSIPIIFQGLLPWKLTCPLQINGWKMYSLLKVRPFLVDKFVRWLGGPARSTSRVDPSMTWGQCYHGSLRTLGSGRGQKFNLFGPGTHEKEQHLTPLKTNMTGKSTMNESMYFLLKMGIFQCHVSFQGCKCRGVIDVVGFG